MTWVLPLVKGSVDAPDQAPLTLRVSEKIGDDVRQRFAIVTKLAREKVVALRFSPDGTRIVCELRNGTTVEWDARTGTRVARSSAHGCESVVDT